MATNLFYFGELMLKMLAGRTGDISRVTYVPDKPECPLFSDKETHLEKVSPESQGVDSAFIESLLRRLSEEKNCSMHRLFIARNGKCIASCGFAPYTGDMWHVTFSMCKSVTGMAIGFLVEDKLLKLDDKLGDLLNPGRSGFNILKSLTRHKTESITVSQLLTMTAGCSFNETGAVSGDVWSAKYMESPLNFTPGSKFEYNSMNSYMLSALVTQITGMSMFEFLKPRLFEPLGIYRVHWNHSPEGVSKGGWGLYMTAEDMCKLGILYLQKGAWEGKQIISRAWVEESLKPYVKTEKEISPFYGYQIWLNSTRKDAFAFNGMLGQDVFCYPDVGMVIVTQAGNDDVFQESVMSLIIHEAMKDGAGIKSTPLPENREAMDRLSALIDSIEKRKDVTRASFGGWGFKSVRLSKNKPYSFGGRVLKTSGCTAHETYLKKALNGAVYEVRPKTFGLMPLIMQLIQNNFTEGITEISFELDGEGTLCCKVREGETTLLLPCFFGDKGKLTRLDFRGEIFDASCTASVVYEDDGSLSLIIKIYFLEEAAARILKFTFADYDYRGAKLGNLPARAPVKVSLNMDETPGAEMMLTILQNMTVDAPSGGGPIVSVLDNTGAAEIVNARLENQIRPEMSLVAVKE